MAILQIGLYLMMLLLFAPPLGGYMAQVFEGKITALKPLERGLYRLGGVDETSEMSWPGYTGAILVFNSLGFLALMLLQLTQRWLPFNPQNLPNVAWDSAFNTAVSFMTNTNWQSYAGETTMSYATQMLGLAVQNFVSAATGIAVLLALVRGLTRSSQTTIGNFWVDLVRSILYVLLPLSIILAVVLASQGVVQTFSPYIDAVTLTGETQTIPLGPAASQIAIKQLGTNGGGFFNANSAHPFENPTPLSNFLQTLAILLLPAALTFTFGRMVGSTRQGWVIFAAMAILFSAGLAVALWAELGFNPAMGQAGSMEGKEMRFGLVNNVLWAVSTTAASNGSVNAMMSSLSPLTGLVALWNMMLGEVIFGGVGAGLYGMLLFVIITVFIAGLMVGRTPEYLGKKIEAREVKMAMLGILSPSAVMLIFPAVAILTTAGLAGLSHTGPHGLSEIMYAFVSAAANNGSAFAGLNANTVFYNLTLGLAMLIGRFSIIIPVLAVAGSMAGKKITPPSTGTFPTNTPLFAGLLIAVVLIVGALTFFPVLSLGPIVEQLLMLTGQTF